MDGAAVLLLLARPAQENNLPGYDLGSIACLGALPVVPRRGLQPPLNVDSGALMHVFPDNFGKPLPGNNVVPFGALLPFAAHVLEGFVRGQAEFGERST